MEEDKSLTQTEKRDLIVQIKELLRYDVLNKDDQRQILFICLSACEREIVKSWEE